MGCGWLLGDADCGWLLGDMGCGWLLGDVDCGWLLGDADCGWLLGDTGCGGLSAADWGVACHCSLCRWLLYTTHCSDRQVKGNFEVERGCSNCRLDTSTQLLT